MFIEWRGQLYLELDPYYPVYCHHQTLQDSSVVKTLSMADALDHVLDHISLLNPGDTLTYSYEHGSTLVINHDANGHYQCRHMTDDRPKSSLVWVESDTPYVSHHYSGKQLTDIRAVASLEERCLELIEAMASNLSVHVWDSQTDTDTDQEDPIQHFLDHLPRLQVGDRLRYRGYGKGASHEQGMVVRRTEQGHDVLFRQHGPTFYIEHISFVQA